MVGLVSWKEDGMSDHRDHKAGTVEGCAECLGAAYEPGWYASMLAFSQNTGQLLTLQARLTA
jgi:hypothetical protein